MVELRECLGFARETFGELRVGLPLWREQFQRNNAAKGLLARFVNHAHAAPAEALEDFELREMRGELLWAERPMARLSDRLVFFARDERVPREIHFHQAAGTKPTRGIRGYRCAAFWA
jgi:hypothetical protein